MTELFAGREAILGFAIALLIGFLAGRTREDGDHPPRPGIRDFILIGLIGGTCGLVGEPAVTAGGLVAVVATLIAIRVLRPQRVGLTTELAALVMFLIGYLCLVPALLPYGAGLGIVLAATLAAKAPLHRFALETLSEREFADTLRFLALVFVVLPMLPDGRYGPFDFFEPRKIWMFVILVSAVSFVGYFLTKFLGPRKAMLGNVVFGGLTSTTAFTAGAARLARETPAAARGLARSTLIANAIMPIRILLILSVVAPALALSAAPPLVAMAAAALLAAGLLCRGHELSDESAAIRFANPFTLGPALRFGVVFALVLCATRAAGHYLGETGVLVSSALGGTIDVDAVLLAVAGAASDDVLSAADAVLAIVLAAAVNAVFKAGLAVGSRQPAFWARVAAGLILVVVAGIGVTAAL